MFWQLHYGNQTRKQPVQSYNLISKHLLSWLQPFYLCLKLVINQPPLSLSLNFTRPLRRGQPWNEWKHWAPMLLVPEETATEDQANPETQKGHHQVWTLSRTILCQWHVQKLLPCKGKNQEGFRLPSFWQNVVRQRNLQKLLPKHLPQGQAIIKEDKEPKRS